MKKVLITVVCASLMANVVLCKLYFFPAETEYLTDNEKERMSGWAIKEKTPDGIKHTKTIEIPIENYRPKRKHLDWLLNQKDTVLADWDYTEFNAPLEITAIELIGFENSNEQESVHLTVTDPKYIELFKKGMSCPWMRRPGYSDLAFYNITAGCGPPYGVVLLHTPRKKLVIGLNCFGFHFGSIDRAYRTAFESWIMAKAIDDILNEKIGRPLNEHTFYIVSGQEVLEGQKNYYKKLTDSEADSSSE